MKSLLQYINITKLNEQLNYDDYLHGYCHKWALDNYKQGDKFFVITDYDYDIDDYALVHCGIYRNGKYVDVRGEMDDYDEMISEFDYGEEVDEQIMTLQQFKKYCKNNNLC